MKQKLKSLEKIKAAVVGGSGYTGLELLKILAIHRGVDIVFTTSKTYKDIAVEDAFPSFNEIYVKGLPGLYIGKGLTYNKCGKEINNENNIKLNKENDNDNNDDNNEDTDIGKNHGKLVFKVIDEVSENVIKSLDVIFLCLPPLESMEFVNKHLGSFDGVVIDVGSDFRLKNPRSFKKWYGAEHILKDLLADFVYGLPEINAEEIKNARLIANPGCYPTSVILALAPILKDKELEVFNIDIDTKSGVSGAGRKLKHEYLFCNVNENFFAYSAVMHRHIGEIEQELENISGRKIDVCFTPHLLPVNRGIFTSIYCRVDLGPGSAGLGLSEGSKTDKSDKACIEDKTGSSEGKVNTEKSMEEKLSGGKNSEEKTSEEKAAKIRKKVSSTFSSFYSDSCFVRFIGEKMPQLKDVVGTNMCLIGSVYDERTKVLKLFSTIDNLLKGAAGQAVQNMNLI
ncbi:MAG: N-acetyl-gamma-glutamyl-phosphate reductase, partial [Actinobacteria bacterium]|nr:N-acetyl-gamma-glutamyl-phosphate reductase [Actinomycetota bacterium]